MISGDRESLHKLYILFIDVTLDISATN